MEKQKQAPRFRWDSPQAWLFEAAATWDRDRLLSELRNLAVKIDADDIQEEYQDEMDRDGYFKPLKAR